MTVEAFQRYLRAKRTVDDRAIARSLVATLEEELAAVAAERQGPLRVLEVGAGVGTMVERLVEWDVLPAGEIRYTAVDIDASNVRAIRRGLLGWADDHGFEVTETDPVAVDGSDRRFTVVGPDRQLTVVPVAAAAGPFVEEAAREWDLLIGAALLDVVGLDSLPTLLSALGDGGLWYFPITFDGGTRFAPSLPADRRVERYYHDHMDAKPGGDSRAGLHALERLERRSDAELLGVAGSDWIVRPRDGTYPAEERYFLEHILGTIHRAVGEVERGTDLTDDDLADWLADRERQLAAGELVYVTHQLDLLGRVTR